MARPLRIKFPGAVYYVTSRSDRREPIFVDDGDRQVLLDVVAQGMERFDAQALAYCLMGNHFHFVLHTREAKLSLLMRHLNGVYTQCSNRRRHGHDPGGPGRFMPAACAVGSCGVARGWRGLWLTSVLLLRRRANAEEFAAQGEQLFRRMVFNILIDNTDDHEKNQALIIDDHQRYRLSPAIDVLPAGQALADPGCPDAVLATSAPCESPHPAGSPRH